MKKYKITYQTQRSKEEIIILEDSHFSAIGRLMIIESRGKNRYIKIISVEEVNK